MIAVLTSRAGWDVLRRHVFARDGYKCMAPVLDPTQRSEDCRNRWGDPIRRQFAGAYDPEGLTLNHVKMQPMMGKKAPDDEAHLITVCWFHGVQGWELSRRAISLMRAYLRQRYEVNE